MRAFTLRQVSERIVAGANPTKEFSQFLDYFYDCQTREDMLACIAEEPLPVGQSQLDALFAASAEYLARRYSLSDVPEWAFAGQRYLATPWFTTDKPEVKEYLSFTSPGEFKSRGIFTEEAPLRRARTWQAEHRFLQSTFSPAV